MQSIIIQHLKRNLSKINNNIVKNGDKLVENINKNEKIVISMVESHSIKPWIINKEKKIDDKIKLKK